MKRSDICGVEENKEKFLSDRSEAQVTQRFMFFAINSQADPWGLKDI